MQTDYTQLWKKLSQSILTYSKISFRISQLLIGNGVKEQMVPMQTVLSQIELIKTLQQEFIIPHLLICTISILRQLMETIMFKFITLLKTRILMSLQKLSVCKNSLKMAHTFMIVKCMQQSTFQVMGMKSLSFNMINHKISLLHRTQKNHTQSVQTLKSSPLQVKNTKELYLIFKNMENPIKQDSISDITVQTKEVITSLIQIMFPVVLIFSNLIKINSIVNVMHHYIRQQFSKENLQKKCI